MARPLARLAFTAIALTLAATLGVSQASAQTPGLIAGSVPASGGVGLVVITADATTDEIVDALEEDGCDVVSLAITEDGEFVTYIPGAPAFVNAGFPASFDAGHAFAIRCDDDASIVDYDDAPIDESARDGSGILTDVRIAEHDGFDRIVFEFGDDLGDDIPLADGVPAYSIEYIDGPAVACGSGEDVVTEGDAILRVNFPSTYVYDPNTGEGTLDAMEIEDDFSVILDARSTCGFEAVATWVIGTTEEAPFHVSELSSPTRLVIDIQTP